MAAALLSGAPTVGLAALARTKEAGGAELSVVRAGPVGEVAKLEEANEIRVVFSEPIVALGRIPATVSRSDVPGRRHEVEIVVR